MDNYKLRSMHEMVRKTAELVNSALNVKMVNEIRFMSDEDALLIKNTMTLADELMTAYDEMIDELAARDEKINEILKVVRRIEARS